MITIDPGIHNMGICYQPINAPSCEVSVSSVSRVSRRESITTWLWDIDDSIIIERADVPNLSDLYAFLERPDWISRLTSCTILGIERQQHTNIKAMRQEYALLGYIRGRYPNIRIECISPQILKRDCECPRKVSHKRRKQWAIDWVRNYGSPAIQVALVPWTDKLDDVCDAIILAGWLATKMPR